MGGPLGIYYGQFAVDADSKDLGVASQTLALTTGSYYLCGYTGEGSQFLEHLQTKLRTCTDQASTNCSYSPTTDRVTIALTTAANVSFDDAAIANICGFSNGTAQPSSATHTGNSSPRYVWRPSRAVADSPVDVTQVWQPRSATLSSRSPDGTTYTVPGATVYEAVIQYRCLTQAETITPAAGTVYFDFQQWFVDVPAAGRPFRYVVNRDQYAAATDYATAIWGSEEDDGVGAFRDAAGRRIKSYQGLWDITIPMYKVV